MSFKTARQSLIFLPKGASEPINLVRSGVDLLTEWYEEETSIETTRHAYASPAAVWDRAVPRGGALKTLTFTVLWEYPTVAQMEADMRLREVELLRQRQGELTLLEAYHLGVPGVGTRWQCTISSISMSKQVEDPLEREHADSSLRGKANGTMTLELTLSHPERLFGIRNF